MFGAAKVVFAYFLIQIGSILSPTFVQRKNVKLQLILHLEKITELFHHVKCKFNDN